ncbi:unnamed protein product [Prunus armeniaca]
MVIFSVVQDWIKASTITTKATENTGIGQVLEAELWGLLFGLKLAADIRIDLEKLPSSSCNLNVSGTFSLHGCQSLREFSELPRYTRVLDLSETAIKVLPSSIECLFDLTEINLSSCKGLYLPEVLEPMEHLKLLSLSCTSIKELPSSIGNLIRLQGLDLHECKKLEVVPNVIYNLSTLKFLNFDGCSKLKKLPPVSVDSVGLLSLEELYLRKCSILEIPDGLLSRLRLIDCKSVESLPELPPFLQRLEAQGCTSLKTVSSSSSTALAQRRSSVFITCSGYEIPNWFSHQSEGSSIKIELRPDWFSTDFLGFALSLVIALNTKDAKWEMEFGCRYNFKTSDGEGHEINHSLCIIRVRMEALWKIPMRCLCGGMASLKLQRVLKDPLRFTNLLLRPLLNSTTYKSLTPKKMRFSKNSVQITMWKSVGFVCCMPKMLRLLSKEFVAQVVRNIYLTLESARVR